jgi:hypothetical protein
MGFFYQHFRDSIVKPAIFLDKCSALLYLSEIMAHSSSTLPRITKTPGNALTAAALRAAQKHAQP